MAEDLKAADVGARYAQALFDLAKETGSMAAVEADLRALKAMRAESRELRTLMSSPVYSSDDKGKALVALAVQAKFDMNTAKFLGLMTSNGRAGAIGAAIERYLSLAADERGAIAAEVTSAVPLTSAQQTALKASLTQSLGRDPELETRVDPSLLGGLKVRVGSRLYDASLRSKLDSLRFALKRA